MGVVSRVPDGYYLASQVGEMVGRHMSTIKKLQQSGAITASHFMQCGRIRVAALRPEGHRSDPDRAGRAQAR